MLRYLRVHFLRYDVLVLGSAAALILLWPRLLANFFNSSYMPHGGCYLWTPSLVWLHVSSDTAIGLSYVAISVTLAYLVHRARRDIPFSWMFLAFGLFIITCGMTHLAEVWVVWNATYWMSGAVKIVTAVASVATALALPPLVPKVQDLIRAEKVSEERRLELEATNRELGTLYGKLQQLDQLKSDFFANVSHELRTPLALILGPTERLLGRRGAGEEWRDELAVIDRNARSLLTLVEDLLALSKLDAGRMELAPAEVDLGRVVRLTAGSFEAFAEERGITLDVEAPEHLRATVDPEKVQRVLLNLASNAFKHTPEGGVVRLALAADGETVRMSVRDSGPGIPRELRETVFDRFRQAGPGAEGRLGGTGLGLAIARELVELHGGTIRVDDAPEGGAALEVELPRHRKDLPVPSEGGEPPAEEASAEPVPVPVGVPPEPEGGREPAAEDLVETPAEEPAPAPGEPRRRPKALVVEDNREMSRFLRQALRDDYRVVCAYDGREGLEKAEELAPDVILTDLMMPRMSGEELLREIRSRPKLDPVPVLVLTAKADERVRVDLLRHGAQDFLTKPFALEELRSRVANLVRVKRTLDLLQESLKSRSRDLEELTGRLVERNRDLEEARRAAEEASRLKDDFLATVSHELRTPLHAILGWATVLREKPADESLHEQGVTTIERNARAQAQIIDDLLDVSRIVAGRLRLEVRPVHLDGVTEEAVETVRPAAEAKSIRLRSVLDRDAGAISGDPARLHQVVWNLLSNAIKFTPKGGRVTVRLRRIDSQVELSVSDSGKGMDPEFVPHVFDRFRQADSSTTRQAQGLGIGLAIVRHLVELHGGTVHAWSPGPDQGSTFAVRLPLLVVNGEAEGGGPVFSPGDPKEVVADRPVQADTPSLEGLHVLVVEDEEDARVLLERVLSEAGARVTAVDSAPAALAALEDERPDLLLSDIQMPEVDGIDLIRAVRGAEPADAPRLPAVALTARAGSPDRLRALSAGFQLHLPKPVDPRELVTVAASLLGKVG